MLAKTSRRVRYPSFWALWSILALSFAPLLSAQTDNVANDFHSKRWSQRDFWCTTAGRIPGDNWEFADDEIRLLEPSGSHGSLLSPPLPTTFDLAFEWKIESKTNSGIKYRVRRFDTNWLGVEYQIIDEPLIRTQSSKNATGAIYDLAPVAAERTLQPPGEWNKARIVVTSDRIEHYLNEALVASAQTNGPQWESAIATSKFFGLSNFGQPAAGDRIMLTDHGGRIAFRNFQLTSLLDTPQAKNSSRIVKRSPQLGNAMRNGWADSNSITLWSRTTALADMVQGPDFVKLEPQRVTELAKSTNDQLLESIQLPRGINLDQVQGACPGAPGEIRLTYFPAAQRNQSTVLPWQATRADNDFTVQWHLEGLKPGTTYAAIVEARPIGEEAISAVMRGSFQTAPKPNATDDVTFCLTTCHDYVRRDAGDLGHKIYTTLPHLKPNFVVHAGDIEYYDHERPWGWTIDLMRFKWARLFALPNNRKFYANTTTYFIKDDHDTLKDDCNAGQRYGAVTFEQGVKIFNEEQFPSRTQRYHTIAWGRSLQIWLLEGRDFRSPNREPDGPDKSILGKEQKAWLLKTLQESEAAFKLVFSPTPIVGPDRANKHDNHANDVFAFEGNELRTAFSQIPGVITFCGDRHWQYASVDRTTGLWEFGCGPGSDAHQLGWKAGDVRPEHQFLRVASGFLSGQVSYSDKSGSPSLTLRHHTTDGEVVSKFVFPLK